ncbi:MAG: phospholipid methyltransferase [Roseibium album]|jgi:phosphatidylethanolamine/phosphatidyl-N-methylethanolamine N-methyltransferase|uniref:16S ribosomal RNA methyltransferase KsgA/Dim1 family protein n=1 Tax=Roseibium album TaxID=311410 RepID=A0A0M6ZXR9_9HYPH|nr:rRNA adenine N-6-methyltransferase family protein [Roseibium album]MBG6144359.1 phosphatidylethanolamine/phosphatidyl-N-methylethanolamine N-methyltransferase [Labrenzia sp. EL_142]MBG6154121.1 phosphatidylethanolamine/phosphatidyl-N-methylethanolamine N-methyltransferase [Labrenzia sp. EL_162]MBG6164568.1 phosphatidylethanolamine/phosphatidyl-N-methylethanolamine N-methyltransferase [Labrenzia sp. EL_195]MBG6174990.1 phosphatidylethanolamine/phosphatidyl-N-methylethanolamine N-methyltransfe
MLKRNSIRVERLREKLGKANAVRTKVLDEMKFIRSWAQNPLRTGAVSPSGSDLATKMASYLTPRPHSRVVELGPGTGVVTKALIDRGFTHKHLNLIEYSEEFCELLSLRYPGLPIQQGDAYTLTETLRKPKGFLTGETQVKHTLDGIVSSLPLLTRSEPVRRALLDEAFHLLKPGAPFIQFSYGLVAPIKPDNRAVSVYSSEWVWKNLPPARVWVYRKGH